MYSQYNRHSYNDNNIMKNQSHNTVGNAAKLHNDNINNGMKVAEEAAKATMVQNVSNIIIY